MLIDVYTKWYTTPINYDNIVNITCSKGIQKIIYMQAKIMLHEEDSPHTCE